MVPIITISKRWTERKVLKPSIFIFLDMFTRKVNLVAPVKPCSMAWTRSWKKPEDYEGKFHISVSKTLTLMSTSITWSNQEARRGSNQFLFAECASHLAHIAAGQVENAFACISGFDTGEKQVDICYYLKRSTRRRRTLIEYVGFVGEDWDDIIRFVSKRWLTLEICWKKEQEKYEGLNSMFQRWSNVSNK